MSSNHSPRIGRPQWILLALLVISILVNYIDRGALSVAMPAMQAEFELSPSRQGMLLSAFFWSYALMQLPAGWMVNRFSVKRFYAAGYLLWTLATALTGFVSGFTALICVRLVLGIGESAAYPAISRLIVENFPEHKRGIANALIDAGTKIGPALSILAGGLLVDQFGWRPLFIALGLGGCLWLIPWMAWVPEQVQSSSHPQQAPTRAAGPTFLSIATHRSVLGSSLAMFALGYVWYFLLTWLPSYFMDVHGLDLKQTALSAAMPFLAMAVSTVFWGWLTDRMIATGTSPTVARKSVALGGLALAAVFLIGASRATSPLMCNMLLIVTCCALGMFTANVWAMTQTMAGPAAGNWTGIQNCIGNLGGVVSPLVAGWSIETTGSYQAAFYVAAMVLIAGIGTFLCLVGPIQVIDWSRKGAE